MLNRLNSLKTRQTNTQTEVSTNPRPANKTAYSPLSWAEIITTETPKTTHPLPKKPTFATQEPAQTEQNHFKKFSIVIPTNFGATKPFKDKTTQESYNRVNEALMEVNAKQDNNPAEARCLLDNRATWTHLADPVFVTSPTTYAVIVHACPTFLDFDDEICTKAFLQQNEIDNNKVLCIQWLGHPKEEEKSHGLVVIQLTDKATAQQLLRGGLIFNGTFMRPMPYTPGPHQCFNCLKTGHQAYQCKNDPTCIKCGGNHTPQDCKDSTYVPSVKRCVQCINEDIQLKGSTNKYKDKYRHSCLSQQCPI
ncbi:hypothetical protein O181_047954 [Austropuccinia psidii MF-1]|uniref:CCHC-type domain-containing protein n=1 Tax=Austropuccinia psidii MF-1 TaxID=1389203 RepID=A0A9Q3HMI6_9BASI|nr:hypothetical protein [Austropuccinia psidii MF-1]